MLDVVAHFLCSTYSYNLHCLRSIQYVIPLAKKLKECGVFGVSSDEYLNYAQRNRQEWEAKGREVVGELIEAATRNEKDHMNEE